MQRAISVITAFRASQELFVKSYSAYWKSVPSLVAYFNRHLLRERVRYRSSAVCTTEKVSSPTASCENPTLEKIIRNNIMSAVESVKASTEPQQTSNAMQIDSTITAPAEQHDGANLKRSNELSDEVPARKLKKPKRTKNRRPKPLKVERTSTDGYLILDVLDLRKRHGMPAEVNIVGTEFVVAMPLALPKFREEEIEISVLGSTGDGIGLLKNEDGSIENIVVVPFSIPGDVVRAKIVKTHQYHLQADFVRVVSPGPERNNSLIKCKYFSQCAGCQLQMLPYDSQLEHKRTVITRAYEHFCSGAPAGSIPTVGPTIGSPLEYGYRTKLTPHFDVPRNGHVPEVLPIGFTQKGRSFVLDIEDCPIATPAINEAYSKARKVIKDSKHQYKRGVTLMYRESVKENEETKEREIEIVEDSNATVTEFVNDFRFRYTARKCQVLISIWQYLKKLIDIFRGLFPVQ